VELVLDPADPALAPVLADERAAERLVARLVGGLIAAGQGGERLFATLDATNGQVRLAIDRPRALKVDDDQALFRLDADTVEQPGAPLLGIGFTLRLVRNLARELGGVLEIGAERLTLRLPAASDHGVQTAAN
jgi:hypothetical protein